MFGISDDLVDEIDELKRKLNRVTKALESCIVDQEAMANSLYSIHLSNPTRYSNALTEMTYKEAMIRVNLNKKVLSNITKKVKGNK